MEKETLMCAVLMFATVAAAAQPPFFQLVCPEIGFMKDKVNTVECTVRGQDVAGAECFAPVTSVKFEILYSRGSTLIGYSMFPACEKSWSHSSNNNGRCVDKDANEIYTYQFNLTADQHILTNDSVLRCYADCATVAGNPLTFNSSESCDALVQIPARKPSTTPGDKYNSDNTSTTPTDTETTSPSTVVIGLGVAGGVCVVMAAVGTGVYCIRKQRSGGQQNAPLADAPPADAPPADTHPADALPANAPPFSGPQVAGSAGPFIAQTVPTTPDPQFDESSVASTEASEASEGAEDTASEMSEV